MQGHTGLVLAGAIELALGAWLGWPLALAVDNPALMKRIGVKAIGRLGQAHLDYIIMGLVLLSVGATATDLPAGATTLLIVGAWVNPTLFLPLAWRPHLTSRLAYKVTSVASFACMTAGTTWLVLHLAS